MKKYLDLTYCNSTDDICDAIEKELIEAAQNEHKSIYNRFTSWLKSVFKK